MAQVGVGGPQIDIGRQRLLDIGIQSWIAVESPPKRRRFFLAHERAIKAEEGCGGIRTLSYCAVRNMVGSTGDATGQQRSRQEWKRTFHGRPPCLHRLSRG